MKKREKIVLMGIGGQGKKVISAVNNMFDADISKIYVDNQLLKDSMKRDEMFLYIPFHLELAAWEPEYPVRWWLHEEKNAEMIKNLLKDVNLLVVALGIGGEQTLVAKELIAFCRKNFKTMEIYVVGSLPFRNQTEYETYYLSSIMIDFLHKNSLAYTIIENQAVLNYIWDYEMAYQMSYMYIVQILEGVLSMVYPKKKQENDICEMQNMEDIWKHPIYYLEFEMDTRKCEVPLLVNPLLPMEIMKNTGNVEIHLQGRLNNQTVRTLMQIHEAIEEQLGEMECGYAEGTEHDSASCKIKILGRGVEDKKKMSCRGIELFPID